MHEGDTHGKLGILRPCKRPLDPEELWRQDHYRQTWSAINKRDEISNSPDKSRERVQGPHPLPPKVWQSGWRGCDTTEDREEYEQEGIAMMTISAMGPEMFEISYSQKSCNENGGWKSSYGLTKSHSIDFSDQNHQEEITSSRGSVREADTVIEQKEERYSTSKRVGCARCEHGEDWRRHLFNSRISESNWVKANTVDEYIFELASRYTLF